MTNKTCQTCRYGAVDELADRICVNGNSEHCADWVGDDDSCEDWDENQHE